GGKQRTDSTHVLGAVRDLNRLELAGECVRAALEAISAAAPGWVERVLEVSGWAERYRARVDSWRLPASAAKREQLAIAYGADGYALVSAVYAPFSPAWLRELPAVQALRIMLVQNYTRTTGSRGREVVKRRESLDDGGEGLPPGSIRLASPYDVDVRWAAKGICSGAASWCTSARPATTSPPQTRARPAHSRAHSRATMRPPPRLT
ncbi:hypothetical protein AB0C16_39005, partial [Nonomuraea sp. NPDC048916]